VLVEPFRDARGCFDRGILWKFSKEAPVNTGKTLFAPDELNAAPDTD
jgi:hypothetical protein